MSQKTVDMSRERALAERRWFLIDADGAVLGRLATRVANLLRGKEKPEFTPYVDCGDFVVVVNAERVKLTGKKEDEKLYVRHTTYPGGVRTRTAREQRARRPEAMIHQAVEGMLPKNRLGRALATKLKVYAGPGHPHAAQKPQPIAAGRG